MKIVLGLGLALAVVAAACSAVSADDRPTSSTESTSSTVTQGSVTSLPATTTSAPTTTLTVPRDAEPPDLRSVPAHGQVIDRYIIDFVGSTEPGAVVTVNGSAVVVDSNGRFSYRVVNDLGPNTVVVSLADDAGNSATHRVSYEFAPKDGWIAVIGDSVILGSAKEIEKRMGSEAVIDAAVSRQFRDAPSAVAELVARAVPPQVIVIALGTNGPAEDEQFNQVMQAAGSDRLVAFVNAHVPTRRWEAATNATLAAGVERFDNAVLIDWFAATEGRDDLFAADGFHPKQQGRVIMAELIASAVFPRWSRLTDG